MTIARQYIILSVAMPNPSQSDQPSSAELALHQALLADLGQIGFFRRGTLLRRFTRCGSPGCHCHADPPQLHGPYWQWTRKVRSKTVTVRLSDAQATLLQQWLANGRTYDQKLADLEHLSNRVTDRILNAARETP